MTLPGSSTRVGDPVPDLMGRERDLCPDELERSADQRFAASRPLSQARDWRSLAACRHAEAELFFPPGRDDAATEQIAEAKAVCARCPVCRECLEFAMARRQRDGIWGGLTDQERRLRR